MVTKTPHSMRIFNKSIANVEDYFPYELRGEPLYQKVAELSQWIVEEFHDKDIRKVRNFWNAGHEDFDASAVLKMLGGEIYDKHLFNETSKTTLTHLISRLYNLKGTYKGLRLLLGLLDLDGTVYEWWKINRDIERQQGEWETWIADPSIGEDGMEPCTVIIDLGVGDWVLDETLDERLALLIQTFLWVCVKVDEIRWLKPIIDQVESSTLFNSEMEIYTADRYNALRFYCPNVPIVGIGWDTPTKVYDCPIVGEFTVLSITDPNRVLVLAADHYYEEELPLWYGIDPDWVWYVGEGGYLIPGEHREFTLTVGEFVVGEGYDVTVGLDWSLQVQPDIWVPESPGIQYVGECPGFPGFPVAGSIIERIEQTHEVETPYQIINEFVVSPERVVSDQYVVWAPLPLPWSEECWQYVGTFDVGPDETVGVNWRQYEYFPSGIQITHQEIGLAEDHFINASILSELDFPTIMAVAEDSIPEDLAYQVDWAQFTGGDLIAERFLEVGDAVANPVVGGFNVGDFTEDFTILERHYSRQNEDGTYYYLNWLEMPLQEVELSNRVIVSTDNLVGHFTVGAYEVGSTLIVGDFKVGDWSHHVLPADANIYAAMADLQSHTELGFDNVSPDLRQDLFGDIETSAEELESAFLTSVVGDFIIGDGTHLAGYGSHLSHIETVEGAFYGPYSRSTPSWTEASGEHHLYRAGGQHTIGSFVVGGGYQELLPWFQADTEIDWATVIPVDDPYEVLLEERAVDHWLDLDKNRFDFSYLEDLDPVLVRVGDPLVGAFDVGQVLARRTSDKHWFHHHHDVVEVGAFHVGEIDVGQVHEHRDLEGPWPVVGVSHLRQPEQEVGFVGHYSANPEATVGAFIVGAHAVGSLTVGDFIVGNSNYHVLPDSVHYVTSNLTLSQEVESFAGTIDSDDSWGQQQVETEIWTNLQLIVGQFVVGAEVVRGWGSSLHTLEDEVLASAYDVSQPYVEAEAQSVPNLVGTIVIGQFVVGPSINLEWFGHDEVDSITTNVPSDDLLGFAPTLEDLASDLRAQDPLRFVLGALEGLVSSAPVQVNDFEVGGFTVGEQYQGTTDGHFYKEALEFPLVGSFDVGATVIEPFVQTRLYGPLLVGEFDVGSTEIGSDVEASRLYGPTVNPVAIGHFRVPEQEAYFEQRFNLSPSLLVGEFTVTSHEVGGLTVGSFIVGGADHHVIEHQDFIFDLTGVGLQEALTSTVELGTDQLEVGDSQTSIDTPYSEIVGKFVVGAATVSGMADTLDSSTTGSYFESAYVPTFDNQVDPHEFVPNYVGAFLVGEFTVGFKTDWTRLSEEVGVETSVSATDELDTLSAVETWTDPYNLDPMRFDWSVLEDPEVEHHPTLVGQFIIGAHTLGNLQERHTATDGHWVGDVARLVEVGELLVGAFDVGQSLVVPTLHPVGSDPLGISHLRAPHQEHSMVEEFQLNAGVIVGRFNVDLVAVDESLVVGAFNVSGAEANVLPHKNYITDQIGVQEVSNIEQPVGVGQEFDHQLTVAYEDSQMAFVGSFLVGEANIFGHTSVQEAVIEEGFSDTVTPHVVVVGPRLVGTFNVGADSDWVGADVHVVYEEPMTSDDTFNALQRSYLASSLDGLPLDRFDFSGLPNTSQAPLQVNGFIVDDGTVVGQQLAQASDGHYTRTEFLSEGIPHLESTVYPLLVGDFTVGVADAIGDQIAVDEEVDSYQFEKVLEGPAGGLPGVSHLTFGDQDVAYQETCDVNPRATVGSFVVGSNLVGSLVVNEFLVGAADYYVMSDEDWTASDQITHLEQGEAFDDTAPPMDSAFTTGTQGTSVTTPVTQTVGSFIVGQDIVRGHTCQLDIHQELGDAIFHDEYNTSILVGDYPVGAFVVGHQNTDFLSDIRQAVGFDQQVASDDNHHVMAETSLESTHVGLQELPLQLLSDLHTIEIPQMVGQFVVGSESMVGAQQVTGTSDGHHMVPRLEVLEVGAFTVGFVLVGSYEVHEELVRPSDIGASHLSSPYQDVELSDTVKVNCPLVVGNFNIFSLPVSEDLIVDRFFVGAATHYIQEDKPYVTDWSQALVEDFDVAGNPIGAEVVILGYREATIENNLYDNSGDATSGLVESVYMEGRFEFDLPMTIEDQILVDDDYLEEMLVAIQDQQTLSDSLDIIELDGTRTTTLPGNQIQSGHTDQVVTGASFGFESTVAMEEGPYPVIGTFIVGDGTVISGAESRLQLEYEADDLMFADPYVLEVLVGNCVVGAFEVQPHDTDHINFGTNQDLTTNVNHADQVGVQELLGVHNVFEKQVQTADLQSIEHLLVTQRVYEVGEFVVGLAISVGQMVRVDPRTSDGHYVQPTSMVLTVGEFIVNERSVGETWTEDVLTGPLDVLGVSHVVETVDTGLVSLYGQTGTVVGGFIVDVTEVGSSLLVDGFVVGASPTYVTADQPEGSDFAGVKIEEYDVQGALISTEYRNLSLGIPA